MLGALNAMTLEVLCVYTAGYINGWSVVDLLWIRRKRYLQTGIPITLVLGNARYQRCYLVSGLAKLTGIELLFLPPYNDVAI